MTFSEARLAKEQLDSPLLEEGGITMKAFITPQKPEDFYKYLGTLASLSHLTDEYAKAYSSDKEFIIRYLSFSYSGNIVHKKL